MRDWLELSDLALAQKIDYEENDESAITATAPVTATSLDFTIHLYTLNSTGYNIRKGVAGRILIGKQTKFVINPR